MRAIVTGRSERQALAITRLSKNPFYNAQLRSTCVPPHREAGRIGERSPQWSCSRP
jgi:hypothetical protein